MEAISLLGMLGICSIEDSRKKQIHIIFAYIAAVLGIVFHLIFQRIGIWNMVGGMLIGGILFVVAQRKEGHIGKGDALLICVLGIYLGFWNTLLLLWIASILAGGYALFIFLFCHKKKEETIAFVPFLLLAYVVFLFLSGGVLT